MESTEACTILTQNQIDSLFIGSITKTEWRTTYEGGVTITQNNIVNVVR